MILRLFIQGIWRENRKTYCSLSIGRKCILRDKTWQYMTDSTFCAFLIRFKT